jgi:hypothetical protein
MNYQILADCLWYSGHILTGIAIVTNHYNYFTGIACVFVGQFITIISRPIGRIESNTIGRKSNVLTPEIV